MMLHNVGVDIGVLQSQVPEFWQSPEIRTGRGSLPSASQSFPSLPKWWKNYYFETQKSWSIIILTSRRLENTFENCKQSIPQCWNVGLEMMIKRILFHSCLWNLGPAYGSWAFHYWAESTTFECMLLKVQQLILIILKHLLLYCSATKSARACTEANKLDLSSSQVLKYLYSMFVCFLKELQNQISSYNGYNLNIKSSVVCNAYWVAQHKRKYM